MSSAKQIHKGQLISKGIFVFFNSLKKRTKISATVGKAKINILKFVFWEN